MLREDAVLPAAIKCRLARFGRVGDEDAAGVADRCQAVVAATFEGVVATGVQDDDVEAVAGTLHLFGDVLQCDRLELDVVLFIRAAVGGHQEVTTADLEAVPGEVEEPDTPCGDLRAEAFDHLFEVGLGDVFGVEGGVEAFGLQDVAHRPGVVDGFLSTEKRS